ncbi:hypothetical protein PLESTB_001607500 [Pleodorina starrii]|uniref:EamA domain-containing protein n=1 Tax=Pleodorina starrii TaxID=330485 RepID=A0A9W6BY50_9CHLO|nr:hypothetical protein PLESTB_001607500 [Pleodorina starrii]
MISSKSLGIVFLFVTSAAWIGASFITQALVSKGEQAQAALEPWLLTLICSSTLMLYLPIGHCIRKRARYDGRVARARGSPRPRTRQRKGLTFGNFDDVALEHATGCLLPRRRAAAAAAAAAADGAAGEGADEDSDEDGLEGGDAEVGTAGLGGAARSARGVEWQPLLHQPHKHQQHGGGGSGEADAAADADGDADDAAEGGGGEGGEVENSQIVRAAFVVAPVWFAAQLAFTASLEYTSVTSNTVLSSCSSLFVYLGSLAMGQEVSSALRFASVIAAMAGTTLVALGDRRNGDSSSGGGGGSDGGGSGSGGGGSNPLLGDALTLIAAALYAMYTIMMKKLLVKDDGVVMALFFGTIGVLYFSVLAPVAGVLALAGAPVVRRVTGRALGLAFVQGLIDYVAADYAWARAVMLLGPTATSCGLAVQIPAAGIIDALINGSRLSWSESPASLVQFIFGSLLIVCGFVGVSMEPRALAAVWNWCTECGRGGGGAAVHGGGGGGRGSGGGACAEAGGGAAVDMRGTSDGRLAALWSGAAAAEGVSTYASGEQQAGAARGGLLGELEGRRARRGSWGGGGGGKAVRGGVLRGMGMGGGGGGAGGSGGGSSAADLQSYIPLSSTAGVAAGGRGAPAAGSPDM